MAVTPDSPAATRGSAAAAAGSAAAPATRPVRGRFITLEGPEGSGKTTAARHLVEWLTARGLAVVLTHEPGGTPLGEEIRRIVLHMRGVSDDLDPRTDALLYAASRAQHVARVILPALDGGSWVVCARFADSSLAYQGSAYGNDMVELRRLQEFATFGLRPDLTLLLDVPVEIGLKRKRHGAWNRFENTHDAEFFEKVRAGYLGLAADEPERVRVIDGSGSLEHSDQLVRAAVEPLFAS